MLNRMVIVHTCCCEDGLKLGEVAVRHSHTLPNSFLFHSCKPNGTPAKLRLFGPRDGYLEVPVLTCTTELLLDNQSISLLYPGKTKAHGQSVPSSLICAPHILRHLRLKLPSTMSSFNDARDLSESMTIPSDSENYDANNELSASPSSSSSPMILYSPPTMWGLLRGAAINLLLPFVNGLMLGFGELFANELAFRFGWAGTKVRLGIEYYSLGR